MYAPFEGEYADVPEHLREGLLRYTRDHLETGGFLMSVFANDLFGAVSRADEKSMAHLHDIVTWIYNEAPSACHGSVKDVIAWLSDLSVQDTV